MYNREQILPGPGWTATGLGMPGSQAGTWKYGWIEKALAGAVNPMAQGHIQNSAGTSRVQALSLAVMKIFAS
jgi:hypothetical protein